MPPTNRYMVHVAEPYKTAIRQKKGELKHEYSKGNTLCQRCLYKNERAQGFICKFVLDQRVSMEDKNEAVVFLEDYLDDGSMEHEYDNLLQTNCVLYSLNKRKRWMIASHIVDLVQRKEVKREDFRLVLHERLTATRKRCHAACVLDPDACGLDPDACLFDPDACLLDPAVERKEKSICYHDSKGDDKYGCAYPKQFASTLTDLSLNCYNLDSRCYDLDNNDDTISTKRKSRKLNYKDVMRGDVHPIVVPEIRYEITYPDTVAGPCKCHTDTEYRYRWETKIKTFRWKAKGNRNKSWSQWYYQGLDHKDHQLYCDGYRDDCIFEEYDAIIPHPPLKKPRQLTIKDFGSINNKCNTSKKVKNKKRKKKSLLSQDKVENSMKVVGLNRSSENGNGNSSRIVEMKWKELVNDDVTLEALGPDFDKSFCSCLVDKDSIEEMRLLPNGFKLLIGNCVPQQLSLSVEGETTQAQLLLWQKSEWSKWSSVAEYWLKILLKSNTCGQKIITILLREELSTGGWDQVYTIYELLDAALRVVNLVSTQQGSGPQGKSVTKSRTVHPTGTVSGVRVHSHPILKTTTAPPKGPIKVSMDKKKKVWESDLTFDGGLLEAYDLLPTSLTQTVGFGFCRSCLCRYDPPLLKGCVLLPCLHYYCIPCWRKYVWEELQKGCTTVYCKQKKCTEVVDEVMIQNLMSSHLYNHWLLNRADKN